MKCPHCDSIEDRVIESRSLAEGTAVRRRRECIACGFRFTSYERIEDKPLLVIKSNGRREPFDRQKLGRGIERALEKRPYGRDVVDDTVNAIEDEASLLAKGNGEVSSSQIGEMVLARLYPLDKVAYIRFASVYRNFTDVDEFIKAIQHLENSTES